MIMIVCVSICLVSSRRGVIHLMSDADSVGETHQTDSQRSTFHVRARLHSLFEHSGIQDAQNSVSQCLRARSWCRRIRTRAAWARTASGPSCRRGARVSGRAARRVARRLAWARAGEPLGRRRRMRRSASRRCARSSAACMHACAPSRPRERSKEYASSTIVYCTYEYVQ